MATDVIMPKVDMDQETGTVGQWVKQEGETVKQGETILEIETDKVAIEVESVPERPQLRAVTVIADFPDDRVHRKRKRRRALIDLTQLGEQP